MLRLLLNDVAHFSSADESVYVDLSRRLASDGFFSAYAGIAREWISDPAWWRYPSPLRFGYLALTTFGMRLVDTVDPRILAWISTLAGIAVLPLLFEIARRIAGTRPALLAVSFAAVSPLSLALGRRALQDEVLCMATLLAFLSIVVMLGNEHRPVLRTTLAVAALTFALSIKESLLLLLPAFAVFVFLHLWPRTPGLRHVVLFAAPPLLWWTSLAVLSQDATMPYRTARLVASAMAERYVVQYQSGPPHRVLFDFLLVAPLVTILACGAAALIVSGATRNPHARALLAFLTLGFAGFALLASKNLRFLLMLDPFVRLLAAWAVVMPREGVRTRTSTIVAVALMNVVIELELFHTIFQTGAVYDPVTHALLDALGSVPRAATSPPAQMLWPWICAAIVILLLVSRWMQSRLRPHVPVRPVPRPSSQEAVMVERIAAIIPALNAEHSVGDVVLGTGRQVELTIVVDDGSWDQTSQRARACGAHVSRHAINRGKGSALKTGFAHALLAGFDGVVTLDADGQHLPSEIPKLLRAREETGADLIIGGRAHHFDEMLPRRRLANKLSAWSIARASGTEVTDSQSGFRYYSAELLRNLPLRTEGFDLESEVIVRAGRGRYLIVTVPIELGFVDGLATSHYHPLQDTLQIAWTVLRTRLGC